MHKRNGHLVCVHFFSWTSLAIGCFSCMAFLNCHAANKTLVHFLFPSFYYYTNNRGTWIQLTHMNDRIPLDAMTNLANLKNEIALYPYEVIKKLMYACTHNKRSMCILTLPSCVNPSLNFGMTKTWTGAWGLISRKARTFSSSYTMDEGISFAMILSKLEREKKKKRKELEGGILIPHKKSTIIL